MGLLEWIGATTPAGAVGEAGAKVVEGVFDGIKTIIDEFHLSPEQANQLRLALEQQKLVYYQARVQDVASARQLEMSTQSRMPALLTLLYSVSFIGMSGALLWYAFEMPNVVMNNFQAGLVGLVYGYIAKEAVLGTTFYLGGTMKEDELPTLQLPMNTPSTK